MVNDTADRGTSAERQNGGPATSASVYERLRDMWWESYLKGLDDYQKHEAGASRIIDAMVESLGIPKACWRYVNRDGKRPPGTSCSFVAATEPQEAGWTTTCFSVTFEKSAHTYPKRDVTVRLWLRAAGTAWDVRLYKDDAPKRLDPELTQLSEIVTQFVDEVRDVLHAVTVWPPPAEPTRQIGFQISTVERPGG